MNYPRFLYEITYFSRTRRSTLNLPIHVSAIIARFCRGRACLSSIYGLSSFSELNVLNLKNTLNWCSSRLLFSKSQAKHGHLCRYSHRGIYLSRTCCKNLKRVPSSSICCKCMQPGWPRLHQLQFRLELIFGREINYNHITSTAKRSLQNVYLTASISINRPMLCSALHRQVYQWTNSQRQHNTRQRFEKNNEWKM